VEKSSVRDEVDPSIAADILWETKLIVAASDNSYGTVGQLLLSLNAVTRNGEGDLTGVCTDATK
jgi:hypothetical protein